jgi:hypothetical protein
LHKELFQPTLEGEARLLLLIDAFTSNTKSLEGRTKLAKLDFLLRYPHFLARALSIRRPNLALEVDPQEQMNIESRMIRYRYGPWDPAYYAILGRLTGRGLVQPVPTTNGIGYRTTQEGRSGAESIAADENWMDIANRVKLLRRHFDLSGSTLKDFIYEHFPEVSDASWGNQL